jgi:dUTP pyrophosphatase
LGEVIIDVVRNPPLRGGLADQLVEIWCAVSDAGGAVGFLPGVTAAEVRLVADPAFSRVERGDDDLVVAFSDRQPVGFGFLAGNELGIHHHWATIKRLQRHPALRHSGVGAAVLSGLEDAAAARGVDRVVLTVRAGTGREGFYAQHGYRVEAVLPQRIWLSEDDIREELVMSKSLSGRDGNALRVQRLDPDLPLPGYAHPGDAGLDLFARTDVVLEPGERAVVATGVAVALPVGCVGLVHPRSGLAARHGIALVNAPGTIDEGYRGEIKVIVINLDPREPVTLARGERIAQLVIQRVEPVHVVEVDSLDATPRGEGGFGSSGR